jgi:Zn-dependent protease
MDLNQLVQTVAIYALPVLLAITLHEAAHGYVARHFGDMTAYAQGRVSLNPARHIDLVGTIIVPIAILALSKLAGGASTCSG